MLDAPTAPSPSPWTSAHLQWCESSLHVFEPLPERSCLPLHQVMLMSYFLNSCSQELWQAWRGMHAIYVASGCCFLGLCSFAVV